jgi:excisionase family DNA binding protein
MDVCVGVRGAGGVDLTTAQAAHIASVSERTVRRWVERGDLRNVGTPEAIRIDAAELGRFRDPHTQLARRVTGRT